MYLIRWPNTVSLNVSPTGHLQSRSVLAIVFSDDDGVRCDRAVLLAEVILPEPNLYRRAASADLRWHYLRRGLRRCQNRHLLLPDRLRTKANLGLRLNPEDVRLTWYERLDDAAELVRPEVLHLSVGWTLVESWKNICVIFKALHLYSSTLCCAISSLFRVFFK